MSAVEKEQFFQTPALEELLRLERQGASLGLELAEHLLEIADRLEGLAGANASHELTAKCREVRERAGRLRRSVAMTELRRASVGPIADEKKEGFRARVISGLESWDRMNEGMADAG